MRRGPSIKMVELFSMRRATRANGKVTGLGMDQVIVRKKRTGAGNGGKRLFNLTSLTTSSRGHGTDGERSKIRLERAQIASARDRLVVVSK